MKTHDKNATPPLHSTLSHPATQTTHDTILHGDASAVRNDNAASAATPDTTHLAAHPEFVGYTRAVLRSQGVRPRAMPDAIAEVQLAAIEAARANRMPVSLAQWNALARTIAIRRAIDRRLQAKARAKYDAGLCEDPDAYDRPTLHWEHRDPVDTKRYLNVLADLFRSGQMPEHGVEILRDEADGVSHAEIAAELGLTRSVVRNRLYRMRARFRARLDELGINPD
jgi:DNA-directed RNA polymerase specialized sigma24 family protein